MKLFTLGNDMPRHGTAQHVTARDGTTRGAPRVLAQPIVVHTSKSYTNQRQSHTQTSVKIIHKPHVKDHAERFTGVRLQGGTHSPRSRFTSPSDTSDTTTRHTDAMARPR
jgi:hypothetical protein